MTPRRIVQKRTKGWRKPAHAVSVARPSRWGNPYHVVQADDGDYEVRSHDGFHYVHPGKIIAISHAVHLFRVYAERTFTPKDLRAIKGKDLMCFCPLDQPCHADVLLQLANKEDTK